MIYFSNFAKLAMQKLQDAIVRSNCVLFAEIDMQFNDNQEFIKFIEKELKERSLVRTKYFTAIQLYDYEDECKAKK